MVGYLDCLLVPWVPLVLLHPVTLASSCLENALGSYPVSASSCLAAFLGS